MKFFLGYKHFLLFTFFFLFNFPNTVSANIEKINLVLTDVHSSAHKGEDWSNLIDGDTDGWDGTVSDGSNPSYVVLGFEGGGERELDRFRLMADTGVDYSSRWVREIRLSVTRSDKSAGPFSVIGDFVLGSGDWQEFELNGEVCRYVKLEVLNPGWGYKQLGELELYGRAVDSEANLTISPSSIDYGLVYSGEKVQKSFRLSNSGGKPLFVTNIFLDGSSTDQYRLLESHNNITLNPGETHDVEVEYSPANAGTHLAELVITSGTSGVSDHRISLTGRSEQRPTLQAAEIVVSPLSLSYGEVEIGSNKSLSVLVQNIGEETLNITSVDVTGSGFSTATTGFSLSGGNSQHVDVMYMPPGLGQHSGTLSIISSDTGEPTVEVSLSGTGKESSVVVGGGEIELLNLKLTSERSSAYKGEDWSNLIDGDIDGWDGTVTDGSTPSFVVLEFASGGERELDRFRLLTDTGVEYSSRWVREVRLSVTRGDKSSGPYTAVGGFVLGGGDWQEFNLNAEICRYVKLEVLNPGWGYKQLGELEIWGRTVDSEAKLIVSPLSVDYGLVYVGEKVQQSVKLSNTGGKPLSITEMSLAGSSNTQYKLLGNQNNLVLNPGETHDVVVEYSPTTLGTHSIELVVTSGTAGVSDQRISLAGRSEQRPTLQAAEIEINPISLSFGQVEIGSYVSLSVLVQNVGEEKLNITNVGVTGSGFSSSASGFTLAGGHSQSIDVKYTPPGLGQHSGTLRINSNDADEPSVTVSLSGSGKESSVVVGSGEIERLNLELTSERSSAYKGEDWSNLIDGDTDGWDGTVSDGSNPSYVVLGFVGGGERELDRFRLLTDTGVEYSSRWVRKVRLSVTRGDKSASPYTTLGDFTLNGGAWQEFELSDEICRYIKLEVLNPGSGYKQLGELELYGRTVNSEANLTVSPLSVDYGLVYLGEQDQKSVRLSNSGGKPLSITAMSLSGSSSNQYELVKSQNNLVLNPGENYEVEVAYSPTNAGSHSVQLVVTSGTSGVSDQRISLTGRSEQRPTLQAAEIDVSPLSLSYGKVEIGGSVTLSVLVQNIGEEKLTITNIGVTGSGFSTTATGFSLSGGTSQSIPVKFSPTGLGEHNGSLNIQSNDSDEPMVVVGISGIGAESTVIVGSGKVEKLALVLTKERSSAYKGEDWSNLIDGDTEGWDGTVTDGSTPSYVVLGFSNGGERELDRFRLLTDTGVEYSSRWVREVRLSVTNGDQRTGPYTVLGDFFLNGGAWQEFELSGEICSYVKLEVLNPEGGYKQLGELELWGRSTTTQAPPKPPEITHFDPAQGAPGDTIALYGKNFIGSTNSSFSILPLGNSITRGVDGSTDNAGYRNDFTSILDDAGISYNLVGSLSDGTGFDNNHEGREGYKIAALSEDIENILSATSPNIILLHIGTNDVHNHNVAYIVSNLESILNKIAAYNSDIITIVSSIIPRLDSYDAKNSNVNDSIKELISQHRLSGAKVYYALMNEMFKGQDNWENSLYADELHPNDLGYKIMADVWAQALFKAITDFNNISVLVNNSEIPNTILRSESHIEFILPEQSTSGQILYTNTYGSTSSVNELQVTRIKPSFAVQSQFGNPPFKVQFENLTSGDFERVEWDFGDGSPVVAEENPTHIFQNIGDYSIKLTVYSGSIAAKHEKNDYIHVDNPPIALFEINNIEGKAPHLARFVNKSIGRIDTLIWEFGDNRGRSLGENPYHLYQSEGEYTASLTVKGPFGEDTVISDDNIRVGPELTQFLVGKYDPIDLTFAGSEHQNPYLDVDFTADFSGPNGEQLSLDGFWIGDIGWKIRFSPISVGTWTFVTTSNDPNLHGLSGEITCEASTSHGFVKTDGYHYKYDDGTPFFKMGDTCWRIFRSKNAPYDSLFKPYIDARAEQGFNSISGVIHTVEEPSINEGGSLWQNDSDLDHLQPGYFAYVDKRIQYMTSKGISPAILFAWAQTFDDFSAEQFEQFSKYIVSRYAAFNVQWIISGEYTETKSPTDYSRIGQLVKEFDPYNHPISIHPGGQKSNSRDYNTFAPWLGHVMQQIREHPKVLNQKIIDDRQFGIPVGNDEFGYEEPKSQSEPYYYETNLSPDNVRKAAWAIVMGGGYCTFGNMYTYTGMELVMNMDGFFSAGSQYMNVMSSFFKNNTQFKTLVPSNHLVSSDAFCLADTIDELIVYVPDSSDFSLELQQAQAFYDLNWLNPKTGDSFVQGTIKAGAQYILDTPFKDDAALHLLKLEHSSDQTDPVLTNLALKDTTGNDLTLHCAFNEPTISYILYSTNQSFENSSDTSNVYTKTHSIQLKGISHGVPYYYKIVGIDPSGNTSTSDVYTILLDDRDHPFIVTNSQDVEQIVGYIENDVEPWKTQYDSLLYEAERIPDMPKVWDVSLLNQGDFEEYKSKADKGDSDLARLTLAYNLSKNSGVYQKAENYLLAWCDTTLLEALEQNFVEWSHSHPLNSLVINIALGYDYLFDNVNFSAKEKSTVLDWLGNAASFIKTRHELEYRLHNIKAWDNAALLFAGLVLSDTALVEYSIDSPQNPTNTIELLTKMVHDDGNICDSYHGCKELWHNLLSLNAFSLIASAAIENNYVDLYSSEPNLVKALEFYAPLFITNDVTSIGEGFFNEPDWIYFSGIYEIAFKYLPSNTTIMDVLSSPNFNNGNGRFCNSWKESSQCYQCSRWSKYPLLIWGQPLEAELPTSLTFTDITDYSSTIGYSSEGFALGVSFADINNNGRYDLFVSNAARDVLLPDLLYVNQNNNTFTEQAATRGINDEGLTHSIVNADFDNDGDLDLFYANMPESSEGSTLGRNALYFNDGNGYYSDKTDWAGISEEKNSTRGAVVLDTNGDGYLDIYAANWGQPNEMYLNDGTGKFTRVHQGADGDYEDAGELGQQGVTCADVDNDGDIDIYVCKRQQGSTPAPNWLFINDGNGNFTEEAAARGVAVDGRSEGASFVDVDNDGDLDLFVANTKRPSENLPKLGVFYNNGDGTFSNRTEQYNIEANAVTAVFGDVDNDADLDMYLVLNNEKDQGARPKLYLNDGEGNMSSFSSSTIQVAAKDARASAYADIDRDGDIDLYLACNNGHNFLLRNDLESSNHYLDVLTIGPAGDYGGFGSKVKVYAAGYLNDPDYLLGYQEVVSNFGYLGQNQTALHFGIGKNNYCDVRIESVTGDVIEKTNVKSDQQLLIDFTGSLAKKDIPKTLSDAMVGEFYNCILDQDTKEIKIIKGELPEGIQFNPLSNSISGIPQKEGFYSIKLRTRYDNNQVQITDFSLTVVKNSSQGEMIPDKYDLSQNYPNPFNSTTNLEFSIPERCFVDMRIYNIKGQLVKYLASNFYDPGIFTISWPGDDESGALVDSGVYFVKFKAGDFISTKKMMFLK